MTLQDGVVLGADTRSTSGSTVADKNCEKIHFIAPNIYCCGAGTAADTENVTGGSGELLEITLPSKMHEVSSDWDWYRANTNFLISCSECFFVRQA